MAYYITGFYKEKNEKSIQYGYYIYNSTTMKLRKISNKDIKNNPEAVKDIVNVRLGTNVNGRILKQKGRVGIKSCFKPSVIENNELVFDKKTLVFISFNQNKAGLVDHRGNLEWISLSELQEITNKETYNNIAYESKTLKLDLRYYHVIGIENKFDILLKNIEGVVDEVKTENIEEKHKEVNIDSNIEDAKDTVNDISSNNDKTSLYLTMLSLLRDDDVVTIPKRVIDSIEFKVIANLEMSMDLSSRVSLGTVKLNDNSSSEILVIAVFNGESDFVKVQIKRSVFINKTKDYSINTIKQQFSQWRANRRFITL